MAEWFLEYCLSDFSDLEDFPNYSIREKKRKNPHNNNQQDDSWRKRAYRNVTASCALLFHIHSRLIVYTQRQRNFRLHVQTEGYLHNQRAGLPVHPQWHIQEGAIVVHTLPDHPK